MLKQLFKLASIELTWIWSARRSATLCARFPPLLMLELIFQLPCFEIPLQCLFFQYLCLRTLNSMSSSVSLSAMSSNPICTPDLDQSNLWQAIFLILGQARFQFHLIILHLESFPTSFLILFEETSELWILKRHKWHQWCYLVARPQLLSSSHNWSNSSAESGFLPVQPPQQHSKF